jgi:hypothetical protein
MKLLDFIFKGRQQIEGEFSGFHGGEKEDYDLDL